MTGLPMDTLTIECTPTAGVGTGDVVFTDGKALDGTPGTEALRLCGDGKFLVRGVPETAPRLIVGALREWTTRALDALYPPTANVAMPENPIDPEIGHVTIRSQGDSSDSSMISMEPSDGGVYVNGTFVEFDDKLRKNFRRVLERLRIGA